MPIVKKFDDAEYIEIDQDILCKNYFEKTIVMIAELQLIIINFQIKPS